MVLAALTKGDEQVRAWHFTLEALSAVAEPLTFERKVRDFVRMATRPETWFLELSKVLRAHGDRQLHAETLLTLVTLVSPGERARVSREALDAVRTLASPQQRCAMLIDLAPHLPGDEQTKAWREAIAAANETALLHGPRHAALEARASSEGEPLPNIFDRLLMNVPEPLIGDVLSRRPLPLGPTIWNWFAVTRYANRSTTDAIWSRLLREAVAAERPAALDMVTALVGRLRDDAGEAVVMQVVQAVRQVKRWRG